MRSSLLEPFLSADFPTQFSALGYLFGRFEATPSVESKREVKGQLCLKQGITIEASLAHKFWQQLTQDPELGLERAYLWRVYFRTNQSGKLGQLLLTRPLPLEGQTTLRHSPPMEVGVDLFRIRGRIAEIKEQAVVVRMERNDSPPPGKAEWQPWELTLLGSLPQKAEKEQFWEIICTRSGESLSIEQAHLVDETSIAAKTKPLSQSKELAVVMITGRKPEITVKFTERPNVPEQGKKVVLQVKEESGVVVLAEINRKTLKRQVEKMDSFADWIAALSGKIASVSPEGVIELEAAGVNVFEKKQKVAQLEKSTAPQTTDSQTTDSQTTAPQKASNQENSTPDPKPEPPEKTKQTFRLVK